MENAAASTSCRNVDTGCTRDYTSEFKTTEMFNSKTDLIEWACKVGRSNGFVVVTLRSDSGKGKKRPRVTLGCERSGKFDMRIPRKEMNNKHRRRTGTKKCGCPFQLKGQTLAIDDDHWELTVVVGVHNHTIEYSEMGHSFAGRLSREEKSMLKDMSKRLMQPKEILTTLKQRDKYSKSTLRTIYNARQLCKFESDKLEMQQWMSRLSKLSEYNHIHWHRTSPKSSTQDFFLTHPTSLDLLHAFPRVLMITKSNVFDRDCWFEIMGVTSTDIQFSVAFLYLSSQRRDNLLWALNTLRGVMDGFALPQVIVTGNCLPLIKAIQDVFGTTKILISRIHVYWNVVYNCSSKLFGSNDSRDYFFKKWKILVQSPTIPGFEQELMQLRTDFSMYPEALEYVTNTWLNPYKEKFVAAWTDKYMHFGIATSDKLERLSTNFQGQLTEPFWDIHAEGNRPSLLDEDEFNSILEEIHYAFESEYINIKASLEKCLATAEIDLGIKELKELLGVVSTSALKLVTAQLMQACAVIDVDCSECGCTIRHTHGLPCCHEIAKHMRDGRHIPVECIDPHWKQLNIPPLRKRDLTDRHWMETGVDEFVEACPAPLREYILDVKDVASDGHCGFKAIATLLGNSDEDGWVKVREDLLNELQFNATHYTQLYRSDQRVNELLHALNYFGSTCLDHKEHWMTMPDMGHIIASCYNVVLIHLSSFQCFTFLPLRSAPISVSSPIEITIGFVNEHFVQVILEPGHPMPPIAPTVTEKRKNILPVAIDWEMFLAQRCAQWPTQYNARIEHYKSLQPEVVLQKNPIVIDTDSLRSLDNTDD